MSVVTNVVCTFGLCDHENDHDLLAEINGACGAASGGGRLVHVEDEQLPRGWFCNGKTLEVNVAIGAFNGLDLREFVDAMRRTIAFQEFGCRFVQLLVQDQWTNGFGVIDVWRDPKAGPAFRWSERDEVPGTSLDRNRQYDPAMFSNAAIEWFR